MKHEFHPWRQTLFIGIAVAVSSQLYLNFFVDEFRISASVILLPVLLMTVGLRLHTLPICISTGAVVFLFRAAVAALAHGPSVDEALRLLPGGLFYVFYGCVFKLIVKNKHIVTLPRLFTAFFVADFTANLLEILSRVLLAGAKLPELRTAGILLMIAAVRTAAAAFLLVVIRQYELLQVRSEHERRYQRLFLMITGLKSELYLMRKNSEEIERVMGSAYRLYELAQQQDFPEEVRRMTLGIARDVHEIKKDYFRIIAGVEEEIEGEYDVEEMSFREVLDILEATSYLLLKEKQLDIHLSFDCRDDFVTRHHYAIMNILKNLVVNAVEAIEGDRKSGEIRISEYREGQDYVFRVTDNGPGMSEKQVGKIFRLGYSTKFNQKTGNIYRGVGLAGVKTTVEDVLGGTIEVTSAPGEGTEFRIRIPAGGLEK